MVESSIFVLGYGDLMNGPLATFDQLSDKIGGDVKTMATLVMEAFRNQFEFIKVAAKCQLPPQNELIDLLKPTSEKMMSIQEFREKNRPSKLFNHLSAISESISALGWVTVSPTPAPYIKEMIDAGLFYSNRVLVEYKDKDKIHIDWVKAWTDTLTQMQQYVKQHHTTGLVWNAKGSSSSALKPSGGKAPPPPPPGPITPLVSAEELAAMSRPVDDGRAALFDALNQGERVTSGLRKVTSEQQTHKNPNLRLQTAAPYKPPVTAPKPFKATTNNVTASAKPPKLELQGKKWIVEYHQGNKGIVLSEVEMNQVIYVFACMDCIIQVKGKVNSIILDQCKKTSLVFENIVSSVEFINCERIQAQSFGKVPTVSIDKTDGVQVYLCKDSLDCEIVSSKSSEMNLLVPNANGEFSEYPIPEQYKTTWRGKGIVTEVVEQKG